MTQHLFNRALKNVFKIRNNGTQPVVVYIQEEGKHTAAADIGVTKDQLNTGYALPDEGPSGDGIKGDNVFDVSNPNESGYGSIGIKLDTGQSVKLGVYADTSDSNVNDGLDEDSSQSLTANDEIWDSLTVHADAEAVEDDNYAFVEKNSTVP